MNKVKNSFLKILKHDLPYIMILPLLVCLLLFTYWSIKPIAKMKLIHSIELSGISLFGTSEGHASAMHTKQAQEVPVLLYHGISNGVNDRFNIDKKRFNEQMKSLYENGYHTLSMDEYINFISGKVDVPDKSILITFDDGRKDSYYRADPILAKYGFRATMFLVSGCSFVDGSKYYLDTNEVLKMYRGGRWDVQSHSDYAGTGQIPINSKNEKGDFYGNLKWLEQQNRLETITEYQTRVATEMKLVKDKIQNVLGYEPQTLAFPLGDYAQKNSDKRLSKILIAEAQKLYKQVFIQYRKGESYSSNYHNTGTFISKRMEVDSMFSGHDLVIYLQSSTAKSLPYEAKLNNEDGWKLYWGDLKFLTNPNRVVLLAASHGGSAEMYLDGTRQLSKYKVSANVTIPDEQTVIKVIAPYKNGENYIGCTFYNNEIRLESFVDGVSTTHQSQNFDYTSTQGKRSELGISVGPNNIITCIYNGSPIMSTEYNSDQTIGGPAIVVWNRELEKARVNLNSFKLQEIK